MAKDLLAPITLPCGLVVPNRMVKAALYEHMAPLFGGPPNSNHLALYSAWGEGGWGMILTGNIQVSQEHLTLGRDITPPDNLTTKTIEPFRRLADAIHANSTTEEGRPLAIMQLSHAGRQSTNFIGGRRFLVPPKAPSAVGLKLDNAAPRLLPTASHALSQLLFQNPVEMTLDDIEETVRAFVRSAQLAHASGFDGVELHAGHGYLLAQFISPESNKRTDDYSAVTAPLHFLRRIISQIDGVLPSTFAIGVKLNAADYTQAQADNEERFVQHILDIARWSRVDFVEISGGSYERTDFIGHVPSRASRRQALFSLASERAVKELTAWQQANPNAKRPLIILTGGLCSLDLMTAALQDRHADMLGIGRLSILCPHLPKRLIQSGAITDISHETSTASSREPWETRSMQSPPSPAYSVMRGILKVLARQYTLIPATLRPQIPKLVGTGAEIAWYTVAMRLVPDMAKGEWVSLPTTGLEAVLSMWLYVAPGRWNTWMILVLIPLLAIISISF
ncbi:hypothetical protein PHLGIDRAFT_13872 [Phlebiopsis gigantea 11061_1 CR5-6]|uniref:NADH:flavin oxidoreductase/NADH oxidase N-terminal domain-containing protein n=1 Tax=Phlebiopsis gigantea (strain 11061_1 CR5-6) TaxID=745531 RepID=A0A0C3PJT3_PHLG1|nr:hypothetical protein PHLGIDRAFT_13872 [Phlebiopsis gigantea 11061_1 CR5-6]